MIWPGKHTTSLKTKPTSKEVGFAFTIKYVWILQPFQILAGNKLTALAGRDLDLSASLRVTTFTSRSF